jgi:chromosome segregation protein
MKLEKIKLSGFKSFVDQTVIPIGRTITAIVGPNGCGKSNIIDAVRWVMGESSAKHLRGGNMADVIFNGCATRKPVSVATVELIFDNSAGKIGGEYSQYAKLAIKRQVSRDGQSLYSLNGNRCRRKDITDLFLGTGLGSRSYAIIEQGTISRMVEAKPDELRVHIEEAAGISKYKERRHETQNHISHTRENLQRLTDLRLEVATQVKQLQKQAEKAEKYVALKKQQRLLKLQLTALRWQAHQQLAEQLQAKLRTLMAEQERLQAVRKTSEDHLQQQRSEQKIQQQQLDATQVQFYQSTAKVAQLAQTIEHEQQNSQQFSYEINQLQQQLEIDSHEYQQELTQLEELKQHYLRIEQELQTAQHQQQQAIAAQQQGQQQQAAWQQQWQLHQSEAARQQTAVQVQQANIHQLQLHSQQLQIRLAKSQQEWKSLSATDLSLEIEELAETIALVDQQKQTVSEQRLRLQQQMQRQTEQVKQLHPQLHNLRSQLQTLTGKMTSLELLQQHALGNDKKNRQAWLKQQHLENQPPLAAFLQVETGWEQAVEIVLGDYLAALCVDSFSAVAEHVSALDNESLVLFETSPPPAKPPALSLPRLLDKINSAWDLSSLLAGVYCVESLSTAQQLRKQLKANESIMTMDGIWLGSHWLKLSAAHDHRRGVLQREQQLRELKHQQQAVDLQINTLEQQLEVIDNEAKIAQEHVEQLVKTEKNLTAELAHHHATQRVLHSKIDQQTTRLTQLKEEL